MTSTADFSHPFTVPLFKIKTTYSLSDQWPTAFKGIAHLGKEQQVFLTREKASTAPTGPFAAVYEIKLESPPARIITFIPGNPASANLRDAARNALVAKLEKYDRTDHTADFSRLYSETPLPASKPLNTNVEKVLEYQRPFLAEAGVRL